MQKQKNQKNQNNFAQSKKATKRKICLPQSKKSKIFCSKAKKQNKQNMFACFLLFGKSRKAKHFDSKKQEKQYLPRKSIKRRSLEHPF